MFTYFRLKIDISVVPDIQVGLTFAAWSMGWVHSPLCGRWPPGRTWQRTAWGLGCWFIPRRGVHITFAIRRRRTTTHSVSFCLPIRLGRFSVWPVAWELDLDSCGCLVVFRLLAQLAFVRHPPQPLRAGHDGVFECALGSCGSRYLSLNPHASACHWTHIWLLCKS